MESDAAFETLAELRKDRGIPEQAGHEEGLGHGAHLGPRRSTCQRPDKVGRRGLQAEQLQRQPRAERLLQPQDDFEGLDGVYADLVPGGVGAEGNIGQGLGPHPLHHLPQPDGFVDRLRRTRPHVTTP